MPYQVDEIIDQNIQINSNKQMRNDYLFTWTLKFNDPAQEATFCQLREDMFRSNMLCVFVVWLFIVLCQSVIIPICPPLVASLSFTTFLLTLGCILVMAEEFTGLPMMLQNMSAKLVHCRNKRTIFICVTIILMSVASSMGLIMCDLKDQQLDSYVTTSPTAAAYQAQDDAAHDVPPNKVSLNVHLTVFNNITMNVDNWKDVPKTDGKGVVKDIMNQIIYKPIKNSTTHMPNAAALISSSLGISSDALRPQNSTLYEDVKNAASHSGEITCVHPEYVVFTWVLCLIALATALKLYYLVKTLMAFIMVLCFSILILVAFRTIFSNFDDEHEENKIGMPLAAQMLILLGVFFTMVTYHARLVEVTSRLDFIWKEQAERELTNMKSNRNLNDLLIKNILPDHVANYYLYEERADELYGQMHNLCGVMFASIPNFQDFYSEDIENGKACIRILNEIICDFDSLMEEAKFASVEKIKTVGATYMAASGLNPNNTNGNEEDAVCDLVEYALAMRQKLQEVNKDAFNTFQLRVGISSGSLVSGVIGARKPVYDIWGNTVNVASRMDSTGENWKIQVPDYTAQLLQQKGYTCVVSLSMQPIKSICSIIHLFLNAFQSRGDITVKGKGIMHTYWVLGKNISVSQLTSPALMPAGVPLVSTPSLHRQTSHHSSLAAVVFGMMQATKRNNVISTREYNTL